MEIYVLAVVYFVPGFHGIAEATHWGVRRMDLHHDYWPYQDVVKAVNTSQRYFLYGYNHQSRTGRERHETTPTEIAGKRCISFKKDNLTDAQVLFTRRYEIKDGTKQEKDNVKEEKDGAVKESDVEKTDKWIGKFHKGPAVDKDNSLLTTREVPNIIEVRQQEGTEGLYYTLVYANYRNCSILRLQPKDVYQNAHHDPYYVELTESTCFVLLSASIAKGDMPRDCQFVFKHACGEQYTLHRVLDKTCKTDENVLGC